MAACLEGEKNDRGAQLGQVTIDFEPFKPINTSLYLCDNKFHVEVCALTLSEKASGRECVLAFTQTRGGRELAQVAQPGPLAQTQRDAGGRMESASAVRSVGRGTDKELEWRLKAQCGVRAQAPCLIGGNPCVDDTPRCCCVSPGCLVVTRVWVALCAWWACVRAQALKELLESDDKFGFIIMDGNGSLFATLNGNHREILHKMSVELPKKHGTRASLLLALTRARRSKRWCAVICTSSRACMQLEREGARGKVALSCMPGPRSGRVCLGGHAPASGRA